MPNLGEVAVVADGMGGHADGAGASRLVVDAFQRHLERHVRSPHMDQSPDGIRKALESAIRDAHAELQRSNANVDTPRKPGSTIVAVVRRDAEAYVAWVADSPAYLSRNGGVEKLTRPHNLPQQWADQGTIGQDEVERHLAGNIVTQAMGHELKTVGMKRVHLQEGDQIVLASDGLEQLRQDHENFAAPGIGRALKEVSGKSPEQKARHLVDAAHEAGQQRSHRDDDVTAVVLELGAGHSHRDRPGDVPSSGAGRLGDMGAALGTSPRESNRPSPRTGLRRVSRTLEPASRSRSGPNGFAGYGARALPRGSYITVTGLRHSFPYLGPVHVTVGNLRLRLSSTGDLRETGPVVTSGAGFVLYNPADPKQFIEVLENRQTYVTPKTFPQLKATDANGWSHDTPMTISRKGDIITVRDDHTQNGTTLRLAGPSD